MTLTPAQERIREVLFCQETDPDTGQVVARHPRRQIASGLGISEREVRTVRAMFSREDWEKYPDWVYQYRGTTDPGPLKICPGCGLEWLPQERRHMVTTRKRDGYESSFQRAEYRSNANRKDKRNQEREETLAMIARNLSNGAVVGKYKEGNRDLDPLTRLHVAITEMYTQIAMAMRDLEHDGSDRLLGEWIGKEGGVPRRERITKEERLTGSYGKIAELKKALTAAHDSIIYMAKAERIAEREGFQLSTRKERDK